ncbi:Uncharacterized protein PECH_000845 [Penicillium ucsense]|uniref:Uncharacterized protein n=1 Tax=Penicillium ucsense TaxID=2839758 RepID=A0A8J8WI81_9EURO|nr:Uncharacterized protein PECM_000530 [Penicillium ucsense]KAF7733341.1 Uncharacterized protein PECH_000845 [Penicillium ucsense]
MANLEIPETGLTLRPGDQPGDAAAKPVQFMRLNLAQHTLDELISSLRTDGAAVKVRMGKHPSLHYGNKSQSFHAYPETHRSEIYNVSDDKQNLYFAGILSHSLEVEKAREDTAGTDQALANLEQSLNAFKEGKASKSTHIIHPAKLNALQRGTPSRLLNIGLKSKDMTEKDRLYEESLRSLPSSPSFGPSGSPLPGMTATSAPSSQAKNDARLQALRTPLIHLLAIRPVSTKFLARQTRSSIEDCTALVQKYGAENRIDREKYDLKDKFYKDLDVWKFPYPSQDDRQAAIDKAISAFDRMRLSRSDQLWQGLLPKEERGKGKCLSRLNLQSGLVGKKPVTSGTAAEGVDNRKDTDTAGSGTDRSKAASTSAATKKPGQATAARARAEKDTTKRPAKNKNVNSTLTGRITKKTGGKAPVKAPPTDTKYKSAEFVHDSDVSDDDEIPDAPSPPASAKDASPAPTSAPTDRSSKPIKTNEAKKTGQPTQSPAKKATPAVAKPRSKERPSVASAPKRLKADAPGPQVDAAKAAGKRLPSSRFSTSPSKPSPLTSPPTSVSEAVGRSRSDSHNQSSSSSSSSPLISQLGRSKVPGGVPALDTANRPGANAAKRAPVTVNPLKRKVAPEKSTAPNTVGARVAPNSNDSKRRRAVSTSSGGSTGSASPPMSYKVAQRRLWDKSQRFKRAYARYHSLHESLASQSNPPPDSISKLEKWHEQLTRMKNEIWEEDRKLRDGSHS